MYFCRLPIDTVSGEAVAEASVKGKKKDAVILCALNACRMLDAHDILRQPAKGTYYHVNNVRVSITNSDHNCHHVVL